MHRPTHGDGALRRHRLSESGASYFLTLCTVERQAGLHGRLVAPVVRSEIEAIEQTGHWRVRGAVIMPDHLHLLITFGSEMALSRCVGRLKAKTKTALATAALGWQGNFYEHRLRADESAEAVLRYLHLNPYREQLLAVTETWSWFWLGVAERALVLALAR